MATKKKAAKPATKNTGATKDAWTPALRKRLSASRRAAELEPKGFFLDPDAAFAALGGKGAAPATLDPEEENDRARRFRFISWKQGTGRVFTDEAWNPLIALWSGRAGWNFVFDRLEEVPEVFEADDGAPWYGVRRYLHAATDEALAEAVARMRPVFTKLLKVDEGSAEGLKQIYRRDYLAYAFDRAGFADEVLQLYVDGKLGHIGNVSPLISVTKNPALAQAVVDKQEGVDKVVYWVFDLVESQGAAAIPLLEKYTMFSAPDRKRVAQALEVARSL